MIEKVQNEILLVEYILDKPIPGEEQAQLQRPLRPIRLAPTTRGLNFRKSQQAIRGFLVGYEIHVQTVVTLKEIRWLF